MSTVELVDVNVVFVKATKNRVTVVDTDDREVDVPKGNIRSEHDWGRYEEGDTLTLTLSEVAAHNLGFE